MAQRSRKRGRRRRPQAEPVMTARRPAPPAAPAQPTTRSEAHNTTPATKPASRSEARNATPPAKPASRSGGRNTAPPAKPASRSGTRNAGSPAKLGGRSEARNTTPPAKPAGRSGTRNTSSPAKLGGRSEARNAAVRATLTSLGPDERPWPLKVATLVALLIGGGDLVVVLIDGRFRVGGANTSPGGVILFSVLMLVCAAGMWQRRYWAVLGFQAILVFVMLFFALLLTRAANLVAVGASLAVLIGAGFLFYKLVRVLSRLALPTPPGR